jgi:hypothetical protein
LIWFYIVVFYSPTTKVGVLVRQRVPVSEFSVGRESSPGPPAYFCGEHRFPAGRESSPAVPPRFTRCSPDQSPRVEKRENIKRERERREGEEREKTRDKRQERREKGEERERDRLEKKEGRRE